MTMRTEVVGGLKWMAGARLCGQVITWAITLVVMRLLAPGDYGLLAMATVFVAFLLLMAEAGLGPALVQKEDLDRTELGQALGLVIAINVGLVALLNLLAPAIADFFREPRLVPILRVLSLQFVIMSANVIPESILTRELRFKLLSVIDLTSAVFASITTLILAWLHQGVWSLVLGNLSSRVLRAVLINSFAPARVWPRVSLSGMRSLLAFGSNVTLARILSFFFNQADAVIVGRVLGADLLGLYSVAMHLASMPVQRVSSIVNQVTFPVVSRHQRDRQRIADFVLRAIRSLSLVAFPVLWGMSSVAAELVRTVLGSRWEAAAVPLQLLALMMPIKMVVNFLPATSDALGRPDLGLQNVLVAALVMPPAFLFASRWGIVGVAYAWIFAYPAVLFFNTSRILKVIGLRLADVARATGRSVLCAAGMYVVVRGAALAFGQQWRDGVTLGCLIVVGVLAYATFTFALNREGFRDALGLLRRPARA